MSGPATATELGKMAYRLNDLANEMLDHGHEKWASIAWGIVDDLTAYGLNQISSSRSLDGRNDTTATSKPSTTGRT